MTTAVTKTFYAALEAALKSPLNYPALTEATKEMLEEASKSEAAKSELFEAINLIQSHPPEEKKVLISMLNALPADISGGELQITQWGRQPIIELISILKEKCTAVFSKNTRKMPPTISTMSLRNAQILQQLAVSKNSDDTGLIKKTLLKNQSVAAVAFAEQVNSEIKFKLNQSLNKKGIESIEKISQEVDRLTTTTQITALDLQRTINEARGGMQTAQDIIIDLGKCDDLKLKALQKKVQEQKDKLEVAVEILASRMEALIASEKCETATNALMETGSQAEQEQFATTVDQYQQIGARAIALVKVEKDIATAFEKVNRVDEKADVAASQEALAASRIALEQTSKAIETFVEIKAASPKYDNPLLSKLRNAQKALTEQAKKVVENPELKKALESNPQVKHIVEQEKKLLDDSIVQSQATVEKLELPNTAPFSEMQKQFNAIVNKTIADESTLDDSLKRDISALAQRTIPLIRIIEDDQLSKADSFSLARMMVDYIDILTYIYDQIEKGQKVSTEEFNKFNDEMKKNGIHDLAEFMRGKYYERFSDFRSEIEARVGPELLTQFDEKLAAIWKMREHYGWQ